LKALTLTKLANNSTKEVALQYHYQALVLRRDYFGAEHPLVAQSLNYIGLLVSNEPEVALISFQSVL
jgi:hypothetical protein